MVVVKPAMVIVAEQFTSTARAFVEGLINKPF